MRAIFWKEIRENLKWAAIAFIGYSLALAMAWTAVSNSSDYAVNLSILSSSILSVTTLCACAFGAALGFLQILPEHRSDRWAFLVHRPIPVTTIFLGKVASGLALYFAAMLAPWLFLCWWASIPGHLCAPFEWGMGCGGLAVILAGTACYFAGMITSLRRARWLGSKAFALLCAVWVTGASSGAVHFWAACAWIALMTAALAVAAHGSFSRNGVYTSQGLVSRLSLVAVFVVGLCMLVQGIGELCKAMIYNRSYYGNAITYGITKAGEPVKMFESGGQIRRVEDMAGNDLKVRKDLLPSYANTLSRSVKMEATDADPREAGYLAYYRYFAESASMPGTHWYYSRSARRLEAYDHDTRKLSGYLTPDGYHAASDGVPASAFPAAFQSNEPLYSMENEIVFGTKLYVVDYAGLTVRLLTETEKASDLKGVALIAAMRTLDEPPLSDWFVVAELKDGITLFKASDGSLQCTIPYEFPYTKDSGTWSDIGVSMMPDKLHFLVMYEPAERKQIAAGNILSSYLYRYSINGTQEKKWELPSLKGPPPEASWTIHLWAVTTSMGKQLYSAGDAWLGKQLGNRDSASVWDNEVVGGWRSTEGGLAGVRHRRACLCVPGLCARPDVFAARRGDDCMGGVCVFRRDRRIAGLPGCEGMARARGLPKLRAKADGGA